MNPQVETEDSPVTVLSPEKIAAEHAAAQARLNPVPDEPSLSSADDVVSHPSNTFNDMASKLEEAMKSFRTDAPKDKSPAPDNTDKKTTDSKNKPQTAPDQKTKPNDPSKQPEASQEPEPPNFTSAKAKDWKAVKEAKEAAEKQAKDWQEKYTLTTKEYEEFRKKAGDPAQTEALKKQFEELQKQRDALEEKVRTVDLSQDDRFNAEFNDKFKFAIDKAKDAAGDHAERVEQLLNLPPSKWRKERLSEIRDELAGFDQGQLDIAVAAFDQARADRDVRLKNSKETYIKLKQADQEKQLHEQRLYSQKAEAAMNAVLSVARETTDAFKKTEDADHNSFVEQSEQFVTKFFKRQLTDTEQALLPVLAMEAKRYSERVVPAMAKKIAELEEALKQYKGGTPSNGAGSGSREQKGTGSERHSFQEIFNREWPAGNR